MPLLANDNPAVSSSFHAKLGRLYARDIDRERVTLFGSDATLKLYKVLPAGRELLATLATGWAAQIFDAHWRVEVIEADHLPWATIRSGAEVEVTTHLGTQRFRVTQVKQALMAGHAWIVQMEPIERV